MQIFIGGTGRSGTSIVGRSLGEHEDIFYPTLKMRKRTFGPEMRFLIDPDGCIDLINNLSVNWSPQRASESLKRFSILIGKIFKKSYLGGKYLNYIFARVLLPKVKMTGPSYSFSFLGDIFPRKRVLKITKDFVEELTDTEFSGNWIGTKSWSYKPTIFSVKQFEKHEIAMKCGQFIQQIFESKIKELNKNNWAESTPFNVLHANHLIDMFPECKILHVYRDPRDVITSYLTKRWGGKEVTDILLWMEKFWDQWYKVKQDIPKDKLMEIKMEDLIADQKGTLSDVMNFLNLPINKQYLTSVKKIIRSGNIGRWKTDLEVKDQKMINEKFDVLLKQLGY